MSVRGPKLSGTTHNVFGIQRWGEYQFFHQEMPSENPVSKARSKSFTTAHVDEFMAQKKRSFTISIHMQHYHAR